VSPFNKGRYLSDALFSQIPKKKRADWLQIISMQLYLKTGKRKFLLKGKPLRDVSKGLSSSLNGNFSTGLNLARSLMLLMT